MSLEFTTTAKQRDPQPITVDWVGQHLTLERPKDVVMQQAATVVSESAPVRDRLGAALGFLRGVLDDEQYNRFHSRATDPDDELNLRATLELVNELWTRWGDWSPSRSEVAVESSDDALDLPEITFTLDGQEIPARPPKDLMLYILAVVGSNTDNPGDQAWAFSQFLDMCLDLPWRLYFADRIRDQRDEFDTDEITAIVDGLFQTWKPHMPDEIQLAMPGQASNRAQRRAQARSSGSGSKTTNGARKASSGQHRSSTGTAKSTGQRKSTSGGTAKTPAKR